MFSFQKKFSIQVGEIAFNCHKLSARNLRLAAEAVSNKQIRDWHNMGPQILEVLRSNAGKADAPAKAPDLKEQAEARYAQYDPFEVVRLGLDSWSLSDPLTPENITDVVDALDQDQLTKLHRGILDESLPPLEPEVQKVMEGKESAPSTSI